MNRLFIFICSCCLLPLLALGTESQGVQLRVGEGPYFPGDVLELHAEMQRSDFAEFELHVPTHDQLHFVAYTREPVQYADGQYVQRAVLLLQPMAAGEFKLETITATILRGGESLTVELPALNFLVASYATTDTLRALAELPESSVMTASSARRVGFFVVGVVLCLVVIRVFVFKPTVTAPVAATEETFGDLANALERGEPAVEHMERLLARADLKMSADLREALEVAVYAGRTDSEQLLVLIQAEGGSR